MKRLSFYILIFLLQSCVSIKHLKKHGYSSNITSIVEKTYLLQNNTNKLLHTKTFYFTKNGRIKTSNTIDSLGNIIENTEKRLWFEKRSYPNKLPHYCKTRWKTKQRERISCYTQKRFKKNEIIVYYNNNDLIKKIEDRFTTFYIYKYHYTNKQLSKILIIDKNEKIIDTIIITCSLKDTLGTCLKQISKSSNTYKTWIKTVSPTYK